MNENINELENSGIIMISKGLNVMPVGQNKCPYLREWKYLQTRMAVSADIQKWSRKYQDANWGIITGKVSNLTVVDFDVSRNDAGEIVAKYDEELFNRFPPTFTVKTPNGGKHLYYKYSPNVHTSAGVFKFVDIRNDGGYVVAYGSTTIDLENKKGGQYVIEKDLPFADFPSDLFNNLVSGRTGRRCARTKEWEEIYSGVPQGSRNDTATQYAGLVLRIFKRNTTEAWRELESWNKKNIPPLSIIDLRRIFESVKSKADRNQEVTDEEVSEFSDVVVERKTFSEIVDIGSLELDRTDPQKIVSFGYDFLDNQLTGLFPGELVIVGGESGTGKTTFAMNIVKKASATRKCMVFALEDPLKDYGIKALFFEINKLRRLDGEKGFPWNDFRKNNIRLKEDYLKYRSRAKENLKNENLIFAVANQQMTIEILENTIAKAMSDGIELFLIDHLHFFDLSRGTATKADYIEKVMVRLKTLQNRTGAVIILVVHYKKLHGLKPTIDSFKDSISIVQNANYVINLWRDRSLQKEVNQETELYIPKSRNPNGEASFKIIFDRDENDYKPIGTPMYGTPIQPMVEDEKKEAEKDIFDNW
jgi:replicative DNA helicase